jgi:hypothetical protein
MQQDPFGGGFEAFLLSQKPFSFVASSPRYEGTPTLLRAGSPLALKTSQELKDQTIAHRLLSTNWNPTRLGPANLFYQLHLHLHFYFPRRFQNGSFASQAVIVRGVQETQNTRTRHCHYPTSHHHFHHLHLYLHLYHLHPLSLADL